PTFDVLGFDEGSEDWSGSFSCRPASRSLRSVKCGDALYRRAGNGLWINDLLLKMLRPAFCEVGCKMGYSAFFLCDALKSANWLCPMPVLFSNFSTHKMRSQRPPDALLY